MVSISESDEASCWNEMMGFSAGVLEALIEEAAFLGMMTISCFESRPHWDFVFLSAAGLLPEAS
jgi:hypothetical protein